MFKVGDTVRNVAAEVVGVVVETDGDMVYLEQSNGCEVEFVASVLILESQFQARYDTSVRDDADSRSHDATYGAVLQNLYPAIVQLGRSLYAQTKRVPGVALKSWDALSELQKLNAISEASDIPVQAWIEANRPGAKPSISTLQLSVLAAKGQNSKG